LTAAIINMVVKKVVLRVTAHGLRANQGFTADRPLVDPAARHLSNIIPALVISRGIALVPHVSVVLALKALLTFAGAVYQRRPEAASRPIKGYLQGWCLRIQSSHWWLRCN
jgi:miniconductance mechanosensitive channel